jgi:predicted kinase
MSNLQLGRYRHYKGKEYTVIAVARHSETEEELVVYRQEYGNHGLWVRPKAMFVEMVEVEGKQVPRFEFIGNQAPEARSPLEMVILMGIQGSGKSSFYKARFADTHVRINQDMLKTRHREKFFFDACLAAKQPFVVDKCNPSRDERRRYIEPAKAAGFTIIGYYLQSKIADCKARNDQRTEKDVVPLKAILGAAGRLELPSYEEGFDKLFYVRVDGNGEFVVEEWKDEV